MAMKIGARKLLIDIDDATYDYLNDYKFAVYSSTGVSITYSDVLIESVKCLKEVTAKSGLTVHPRPESVRQFEAARREYLKAGKEKKKQLADREKKENGN